jgi:hypothetical protein
MRDDTTRFPVARGVLQRGEHYSGGSLLQTELAPPASEEKQGMTNWHVDR